MNLDNESDDTEDSSSRKKIKISITSRYGRNQDCYGCVAFQPALSELETAESQQEKKNLLLNYFHQNEGSFEVTKSLLRDTFPSQRVDINRRDHEKRTLVEVLKNHWPHLMKTDFFLDHASTLLGKEVLPIWNKNLALKVPEAVAFFRSYCEQYRKKKEIFQKQFRQ